MVSFILPIGYMLLTFWLAALPGVSFGREPSGGLSCEACQAEGY
jgi:hypothetical protein